jgi:hypothetical protein
MGQRYCVPQASKAGQRKQMETGIVPNNNHAIRLVFGKDATFVEQKSYSPPFWALWVTGRSRFRSSILTPSSAILTTLITSKTRLKLLLKFFTNPQIQGHLRGLAEEFGDSTNSVRLELNKLEEAGLLVARTEGQKVVYEVNKSNPFYSDLVGMVSKFLGFDVLVAQILEQVGNLEEAYVVGDYARGVDSGTISVVLVGDLNEVRVHALCARVSTKINRTVAVTIAPNAAAVSSPFLQIV